MISFFLAFVSGLVFVGCDCQRLKKCEWYLEPEEKYSHTVKNGYVSICVRNYVIKKEKCHLQMSISDAEKGYGKSISYSSLKIDDSVFPRMIISYKTCSSGN